ncbi:hypothetical protein CBM2633_B60212 [Cupriavidus taiwanensis]|nr:hypothetical protein CBM2633_B60212 [Cupriavidus taiwanensis]
MAKAAADRDKDRVFCMALIQHGYVLPRTAIRRVDDMPIEKAAQGRLRARIKRWTKALRDQGMWFPLTTPSLPFSGSHRRASELTLSLMTPPEAPFPTPPKKNCESALGFDFDGATFTHVGDRVSFEVLLASFGLEANRGLSRLARMVHALDIGGVRSSMAPPRCWRWSRSHYC